MKPHISTFSRTVLYISMISFVRVALVMVSSYSNRTETDTKKLFWICYAVRIVAIYTCAQISRTSLLQSFYFMKIIRQPTDKRKTTWSKNLTHTALFQQCLHWFYFLKSFSLPQQNKSLGWRESHAPGY